MAKSALTVRKTSQFNVVLKDVPGSFADLAQSLQKASVNIQGICRSDSMGKAVTYHLVVDKADAAKKAIGSLGLDFETEDAMAIECSDDRPGVIASVARKLGNANINIENIYASVAGSGGASAFYVCVAKDNFEKAYKLIKDL